MDLIVEFVVVVVVVEEVMVEEVVVVAVRELIDVAWRIIVKYTLKLRYSFIHGVTCYEYSYIYDQRKSVIHGPVCNKILRDVF